MQNNLYLCKRIEAERPICLSRAAVLAETIFVGT